MAAVKDFAHRLVAWQRRHGRHNLPWQVADPYAVWLSEIMLQQTRVETVIPYYQRFMTRFPDIAALAAAPEDAVLAQWSGLGYYARARNLHAAARRIAAEHGGRFPRQFEAVLALPGIGRSTAAAIAAFAFGERRPILDGNVKRVFCRLFGIDGRPGGKAVEERLWALAHALLPTDDIRAYTQGLMDLGATLCRRAKPDCDMCPFAGDCVAHRRGLTAELPAPSPRKSLPEKATAMLVLMHAGELLLEKRPPTGIWGGLWSLPECSLDEDPELAARGLGYHAALVGELPTVDHSFSHFKLRIQPLRLAVAHLTAGASEPGRIWLSPQSAADAALPSPVRRIIYRLAERASRPTADSEPP